MKQTTELKAGGSDDREGSCKVSEQLAFYEAATDDERTAILSTCPKTCGYCCLSEAYQCEDKDKPSIDCTTVTMDMCKSDLWKPVLAENCPKTCGLCKDSPGSE
ncbi:shTK domain protein [Oesophagostomum dentatum]|uniref:ShTK domain protein n=1 Tax=Oesophagostomum dentatum TaxID=61180 RepID=A0A0B1T993_OESDE|nr:shTK domain protein [Oesophagostomum dentatum]